MYMQSMKLNFNISVLLFQLQVCRQLQLELKRTLKVNKTAVTSTYENKSPSGSCAKSTQSFIYVVVVVVVAAPFHVARWSKNSFWPLPVFQSHCGCRLLCHLHKMTVDSYISGSKCVSLVKLRQTLSYRPRRSER